MQPKSTRTTVRRKSDRGHYDRETINAILDEALIAHVGFVVDGAPTVIPMTYARVDDDMYLHGATGNAMLRSLAEGGEICVTVTLLDALVLSRSAFHHSMNYRSVVAFGRAAKVEDDDEKMTALLAVVDHMVEGRSAESRTPNPSEMRSTLVIRFPLDEASAKVRTGPPIEDPDDLALPYWGGLLPLHTVLGEPDPDEHNIAPEPTFTGRVPPASA